MLAAMQRPDRCIHLLRPGRLVRVRAGSVDWGWGVVVSVLHTPPRGEGACAGFPWLQLACIKGIILTLLALAETLCQTVGGVAERMLGTHTT